MPDGWQGISFVQHNFVIAQCCQHTPHGREFDAVFDVELGGLAQVLDVAHNIAGQALVFQFGSDAFVEQNDRLAPLSRRPIVADNLTITLRPLQRWQLERLRDYWQLHRSSAPPE